jgi:hypothetical protein
MEQHIVFCFLGMAGEAGQKFFRWPHWERCALLLDALFQPFSKTTVITSRQAFVVPLKPLKRDPPGMHRVTFKNVPLGKLRWKLEDNRKWSQKLDEKGEYPIRLLDTEIVSSPVKLGPPAVQVCIFDREAVPGAAYNQILVLTVTEAIFRAQAADYWDNLVDQLAGAVHAVRIGRTERPWWLERQQGAFRHGSSLAGAHFSKRYDSLELDDSWQTWKYLKT